MFNAHAPERILVTGGNGFMGRHLVRRLVGEGRSVTVLDVVPPAPGDHGARFVEGSVLDAERVTEAARGAQAVVHLAAKVSTHGERGEFERINVEGTRVVAQAAKRAGVRRFVAMSSVAVFDYRRGFVNGNEEAQTGGHRFAYGVSKLRSEAIVRALESASFETVILRPGLLPIGPGDKAGTIELIGAIARRSALLVGGGNAILSTSYIHNLIHGIVLALDHPAAAGQTFHLCDDCRPTWRELVLLFAKELGIEPNLRSVPRWVAAASAWAVDAVWSLMRLRSAPPVSRYAILSVTHDLHFCSQKAKHMLGYTPKVALADAVAASVEWYRGQ